MKPGDLSERAVEASSVGRWWRRQRWQAIAMVALLVVCLEVSARKIGPPAAAYNGAEESPELGAQVAIVTVGGRLLGGGTIVHRQWVLTAAHLFDPRRRPDSYEVITGVNDVNDRNRVFRGVARVIGHPTRADIALVQLAEPLPEDTVIPRLAEGPPNRYQRVNLFGWAPDMMKLRRLSTVVYDPVATENSRALREWDLIFSEFFPTYDAMVMAAQSQHGDSGSGSFLDGMILVGVQSGNVNYHTVKKLGKLSKRSTKPAFHQPVWQFRDWIERTIAQYPSPPSSSPSSSSGAAAASEPSRRGLSEESDGALPMSSPPQVDCASGAGSCPASDSGWLLGKLPGSGNYRGTALAVCASVAGNRCSFGGTAYSGGAIGRLSLGPSAAPGTAPQEVMVWCRTSAVFATGAAARPALRVSFTNGEADEAPEGMGWWDLTPDQVVAGTGQAPVDPARFATC